MNEAIIRLVNVNVKDYYTLADILKRHNINNELRENKITEDSLGFGFSELVVLLPLTVPLIAELRQAFESYLNYKSASNKVRILIEKDNEKLEVEGDSGKLVQDLKVFEEFFNKCHQGKAEK